MVEKTNSGTYGEHVRHLEVEGLTLTECLRPPGLVIPSHAHEYTNISLVIKGTFMETVGRTPHECSPSSLIIRPAGESHSNHYSQTGARCLIIEVKPQRLEMLRQVSSILDHASHLKGGPLPILMKRLYREFQTMDSASSLSIESLTLEMLVHASRQNEKLHRSSIPRWLCEAKELIDEHFSQSLSLSIIAETVGVHPSHLAKRFQLRYQCTVGEYLRRVRLDFAARELTHTDRPISEISIAAGFYDQSHFTHAFKLQLGLTPSELRAVTGEGKAHTKRQRSYKTS
jgi:AraC family transcriptional regulator